MTTTTWALLHDSGAWLTYDPSEPGCVGWELEPPSVLLARDPILFAARIRQALAPATRARCRLVEVST
jgi:hypothetical protein